VCVDVIFDRFMREVRRHERHWHRMSIATPHARRVRQLEVEKGALVDDIDQRLYRAAEARARPTDDHDTGHFAVIVATCARLPPDTVARRRVY